MFIASDGNGRSVFIENINSKDKYYCPFCLQELDIKWGSKRRHCFAHKRNSSQCTDSWNGKQGYYDNDNSWHYEWQRIFPAENQEVRLTFGSVSHRADVVVDNTVIEFQHSALSHNKFDQRTNYYHSCECKVIWMFDLIEDYSSGVFVSIDQKKFLWKNRKRTFDYFDIISGDIELFFQLKENLDEKSIVRISSIEGENKDLYEISGWFTKEDFLRYVGYVNGAFPKPNIVKINQDPVYLDFAKKYNVNLNTSQERSLQHINGATMLLAVPGSGKTTTLINRLGYMVNCKNINPESILAITYTKKATYEMRTRFASIFGKEDSEKIDFRTINSLCYEIVGKDTIKDWEQRKILKSLFLRFNNEYPVETDYMNMESEISYIKNMMLKDDEVASINWNTNNFIEIYNGYCLELKAINKIDIDDQLVQAFEILKTNKEVLDKYTDKYSYICVDEAQDTSKIQHAIIKLLVSNNNIFMVGDEDQSIYGYRGAFPQALFNFKHEYNNPFVLKLENNYRSNTEIVDVANKFIKRNPNRLSKTIVSELGTGGKVEIVKVDDRIGQIAYLTESLKRLNDTSVAILYRNNDSAIPLIDAFEREGISYNLNKANNTFFSNRIVTDIKNFILFSRDLDNKGLFFKVYNKFNLYFRKQQAELACSYSRLYKSNLLDEFYKQKEYSKHYIKDNFEIFVKTFRNISNNPLEAIKQFEELGYMDYMKEKGYGLEKIELVKIIAGKVDTLNEFIERLEFLENIVKKKIHEDFSEGITLSTIHSCKGMEFDEVFIIDAVNGILPSRKSMNLRLQDKFFEYEEERRLMYVAITRAKHHLALFSIENYDHDFIDEIEFEGNNVECILRTKQKTDNIEREYELGSNNQEDSKNEYNSKNDINEKELLSNKKEQEKNNNEIIKDTIQYLATDTATSVSFDTPQVKITTQSYLTIDEIWQNNHATKLLIVENNNGDRYKITSSPRLMINKYNNCYGEPYGPGKDNRSRKIPGFDKKIWKYCWSK